MPELPEVETIKRGLAKVLIGKKIADMDCDWHKMINMPLAKYRKNIKGLKIKDVRRRAKMIILDLSDDWKIMGHLKMTGQLVFKSKSKCLIGGHPIEQSCATLPNKFTHATLYFSDNSRLFFNDVRKFGWLRLYRSKDLAKTLDKMKLGPEPFDKKFSVAYLTALMKRKPKSKVKQFIMNPENVVGVGNIYSDEVCFYAKVKPTRVVGLLSTKEIKLIYDGIIKILKAAIKAQGTTFSNYVNAEGEAGGYTKKLKVYQRYGKKCYRCPGIIKKMKIGGRTSSFCPKCQK